MKYFLAALLAILLLGCAKPAPPTFLKAAAPALIPPGWSRAPVGSIATIALPPKWTTTDLDMSGMGGGSLFGNEFGMLGQSARESQKATGFMAIGPNSSTGLSNGMGMMIVLHYDSEGKRLGDHVAKLSEALSESGFISGEFNQKIMPLPVGNAVRLRANLDFPGLTDGKVAQEPRLICYLLEHGETQFATLFLTLGSDNPQDALSPRAVMESFRLTETGVKPRK